MDYKSHAPAGLALACGVAVVTGMPIHIPYLIGSVIGGLLPDIDQSQSKVNSLGTAIGTASANAGKKIASKTKTGKTIPIIGILIQGLGMMFDKFILRPLTTLWRLFAQHVLGKIYKAIYDKFHMGKHGWSSQDPWVHRGGATHSLLFLLWSSFFILPISWLISLIPPGGSPFWFWLGCEIGVISHLLCDAVCVSGTKFFWPWFPKIGFEGATGGKKGHDIRIVPKALQMKTSAKIGQGKNGTRYQLYRREKKEIINSLGKNTEEYKEFNHWYYRKNVYKWTIIVMAVLLFLILIFGIGPASGLIAWGNEYISITKPQVASQINKEVHDSMTVLPDTDPSKVVPNTNLTSEEDAKKEKNDTSSDNSNSSQNENTQNTETELVVSPGEAVPETEGPTSLTFGDLDIEELPKGIVKLPDETLWVVGVGPVNKVNLESPTLSLTQAEKDKLLTAAAAQRMQDLPGEAGQAMKDAADTVADTAKSTGNFFVDLLNNLFGVNSNGENDGSGIFGFKGLTPFTDTGNTEEK